MEATNATSPHVIKALAEAAFHVYDTRNPLFQPAEEQKLLDLLPEGDKTLSDSKIRMQVHRMRTADDGTPTFVAAIRGSDNLENWLVNLQATLVPADKRLIGEPATGSGPATPMVHSVWQMIAIQLCNVLEEVLSKHTQDVQGGSSHLYCVGHSLGGALSVLLALVRSQRAPACKVHVFTWGAPMAGNDAFNGLCKDTFASDEGETRAVQFVNDLDVVPRVPSEALGFSPWLEAQVKIDTPESRSLLGPLAAAPGAIKMLLSGRKAAAVAKVLNCTKDQLKHMHSCDLYFDLTLCQLGERPATQMVQSSEQTGVANVANAIRAGGLVYELGGHVSEIMPRQQGEAFEAAAGLLTHGTKAAEWVAKASLAAGAANLAVTLIAQGVVVRSMWRLEEAVTGMRDQLSERSEQLERMEAGVIEKIDGSFKQVDQQLKGVSQQLSRLDELVRDIPSQLRDARIDGCMEELRAAVKLLDDRDEQVWRQASVDSTKLFTRICHHLDDRRGQIEAETEYSSRHLLPFERYYKDLLQLHLRATNCLAKIAGPHASSYSTEVIRAASNQLSGTQRNTHEALLANAGFLLWHASACGPDGATVVASDASSRSPHQRPALYCSLLGTVENLLPNLEGPSQGPSDLGKSVYFSWLRTFTESALDSEWADSVLRLCQRELKHGHSLARARAFYGACQILCTTVDADVRVDLPVEVLTSSKIFPGGDVILSLAQLYVADHPEQSSRRDIVRTYVDSLINHPRSIAILLLQRIKVVPYSVLGQQLVRDEGVIDRADHPDTGIAFCDPADVSLVQGAGPGCAGGASGAIYDFLGIRNDNAFPQPVREAVTAVGLAKHHAYPQEEGGGLHCIHTVGPNFNCRCALRLISPPRTGERAPRRSRRDDGSEHSRKGAQEELATAYANVLCEFHAAASAEGGPTELRMLPISGGVFAGPFADEIAPLTMDAIGAAAVKLPLEVSAHLLTSGRLQLCIYLSDELDAFVEAHRLATGEALQAEHLSMLRLHGGEEPRLLQISLALDRAGVDLAEKQQLDLARGVAALVHMCDGSAQALGQWLCASQSAPSRSRSTEDLEEVVRARLRELVRSAESADDMGQLRASLDAMRVAGMEESGLEQARRRLERHVAAARLSAARQGSEMSELWVAIRQAEKLGLDCEGAKLRMDELTQPDKTELRPSFGAYGAAQRAEMHDWLIKQANAANTAGDTAKAASLFAQASALDPRPTTTLSYVNMCLKMGEYELAAACYERLLTEGGLSDKARAVAQRKRADADAAIAEQQRHLQAVTDEELASFLANRWFSKYTGYLPNFTLSPEDKLQQVKACCGPGPPWTDRAGWRAASERMLLYLIRTQMPNLTSLDADGTALPIKQLTGADPTAAIDLSQQPLGELSATIIGNLVRGNTALERLNLEGIELNVQQLRGNAPVETVDLSKRRLGVFSTIVIGHLLAVNTSLITLNLFNNGISDYGAKAIADALTKNRSLTELNLGNQAVRGARDSVGLARSEYGIGDVGASAIADALKTNATLVRLYLNNNCIGDDGANALADALRVNTNHKLVTLNLSGNEQVCGQATAAVRAQLKASHLD